MRVKFSTSRNWEVQSFPHKRQIIALGTALTQIIHAFILGLGMACLGVALSTMWSTAQAAEYQSHEAIFDAVHDFLKEKVQTTSPDYEIQLGRIDSRLRLQACAKPLDAYLPPGSRLYGKLSVGVRCSDDKPWNIYLSANIKVYENILTSSRPLSRGDVVTAYDVQPVRLETSKFTTGYFVDVKNIQGKIARRSIPAGRPLTPNLLRAPLLVQRGEEVTILAGNKSFSVRVKGKALHDAAKGDVVAVRNTRSKRVVEGIAIKPGVVQVRM
jgi:flagella basal body P-ring formation protein FlgA